ncbi:type II toxin-antitoxin system VapC family toxin [Pseudanabaena minima]|uniref:type II toxin-antitoxin system VapC family toxin n=1 Tax=Pseudanabaena minima TaxID=890415 RepID=UPI003DA863A7
MKKYIFDTDHLSLYGRANPYLIAKLEATQIQLHTTVINVEEQLRGRLAQISEIKDGENQSAAYRLLSDTILMLSDFDVLQYNAKAREIYQSLKAQRIRVGTQDMRIASIVIAYNGILLTRNRRDFEKIPNLMIEDWTV